MAAVSTFPAFIDSFRNLLTERPGLSGVNVLTAATPDPADIGAAVIVLAYEQVSASYEYVQGPGQLVDESYDVECDIFVGVSGGGETNVKAARDRAFAILEQVHDELASSSATTAGSETELAAWDARITAWKMQQLVPAPDKRVCELSFTVTAKGRFTPA